MEFEDYVKGIVSYLGSCRKAHEDAGDTYNLFQVIHMTANETSVHSAFLSDMLNPRGRHHMGGVFLRLFVDMLPYELKLKLGEFDADAARVSIEDYIGEMTDNTGGRLDIIIRSVINGIEKAIIIENKIHAVDQYNQMIRYYNYAEKHYKGHYLLLYLSLDGKVHDMEMTAHGKDLKLNENEHFYTISYSRLIRQWLAECRKRVEDKPLIREAINHYINLIGILTGQNTTMKERKDIACMLAEHPEYIMDLESAIELSKRELQRRFWHTLVNRLKKDLPEYQIGFWSVKSEDKDNIDTTQVLKYLDDRIDSYTYKKDFDQFGISLKINEAGKGWSLYFVVSVNYNLLFQISASYSGDHNKNQNDEVPEKYKLICGEEISGRRMQWSNADYRLWGTYPFRDEQKLAFGKPDQLLYSWCADMDNNVAYMVNDIKSIIDGIQSILNKK